MRCFLGFLGKPGAGKYQAESVELVGSAQLVSAPRSLRIALLSICLTRSAEMP